MSKIEKINLSKTIDYSTEMLEYFIQETNESNLVKYDDIIEKIYNANKTIQIASTSTISDGLIDAIYQNNNINIYIILQSFNKSNATLEKFSEKRPAILREINQLENNFIIIDDISYFFINSLKEKENIIINFDKSMTKDLSYIFNYYFWDCASNEKLINNISTPAESPFPPIGTREQKFVNIQDNNLENCNELVIPRDEKYLEILDNESSDKYFSDAIKTPVFKNSQECKIGNIIFKDESLTISNRWVLKNNHLKDIDIYEDIIPRVEDWNKIVNILDSKEIKVASIEADSIENMQKTKPDEFKQEAYIKSITFNWEVTPPLKPNMHISL